MEKYDITKPMKIPVGMHKLNGEPGISFQLNRLVNMDGCDLAVAKEIGPAIKSASDFYRVLKSRADSELEQGHIKNAAALYRMYEFYTDWEDENGLNAWKKARELFFQYYADFFSGERPIVKLVKVPYEGCEMPVLKFNAESPKGTIVMHGGFDSSYEEFFSECEYLRERGYDVYMIRETHDVNISNSERAKLAAQNGADILVRVHANGDSNQSVYGALTMAPSSRNTYLSGDVISKSQKLSQKMIAAFCKDTGAKNRDVIYTDSMSGINWSTIPVTIIELGFMSNPSEDRLMATEDYRNKMAQGIADGIDAYYE